ncbi:WXG100 family type VII secretion target [Streptomyces sp. NPDC102384]|uniref:WXG100 family type VII secretion target n=1 Tax=Streptomyces sp. NPDC102384 TaxID=3366166 RepID=UPI00380C62DC
MDEVIKGVLGQLGVDDWFDWVTGESDTLARTAEAWRACAKDIQDVLSDLEAERKAVERVWAGEAAEGFSRTLTEYEEALHGEAEDCITIAELLEQAAEACKIAEQAMEELLVELVEVVLASLATTAVLSLLTAGAAAAIGPVAAAAGAATKAAKATRIAGKLATQLEDLAKRTRLLAKASKLRRYLRSADKDTIKHWKKAKWRLAGDLARGNRPDPADLAQYMAVKGVKSGVKGALGVDPAGAVTGAMMEGSPAYAEERVEYVTRPDPQSFDDRFDDRTEQQQVPSQGRSTAQDDTTSRNNTAPQNKPVKDVFG